MLRKLLILHKASGVPLFKVDLKGTVVNSDDVLLGGMLRALGDLAEELKIGDFSSFKTSDKFFLISSLKHILVVLVLDREDDAEEYKQFASEIAWSFETTYSLEEWDGNVERFSGFKDKVMMALERLIWRNMSEGYDGKNLPNGVVGYVLYDRGNRRFWAELKVDVRVLELIQLSETMPGEVVKVNDELLTYLFIKKKREPFRIIALLSKDMPDRDVQRYVKLFEFICENAMKTITLNRNLVTAAKALFGEETIDEFMEKVEGKFLLEILMGFEDPLQTLEVVRKMDVRGMVSLD